MKPDTALLLILFLVIGCTAAPQPSAPTLTVNPTSPPTNAPTTVPTAILPPVVTVTALPTVPPAAAHAFYRLRVVYETTSDWSTLELRTPENVLTMRLIETVGSPQNPETSVSRLTLNQPLEAVERGSQVGIMVDYALEADAAGKELKFLLRKGALNGSEVRVFLVLEDGLKLLKTVSHQVVVKNNPDYNPLYFSVGLQELSSAPLTFPHQTTAALPKLLWAFYYPWYSLSDWSGAMLADHPLSPYLSSDRAVMERHIQQAKEAGIDGFISSWWGPGSYTDQNLKTLLKIAHEKDFWVAIYFETLTDHGPRPESEIYTWLANVIASYRDHPAYLKVNGKPLIVVWASGEVPLGTWERIFTRLHKEGLDGVYLAMGYGLDNLTVFDGLHEYGVFNISNLDQVFKNTSRGVHNYGLLSEGEGAKIWAATVQPGYDERLIPGRTGLFQERENGAIYRSTFEAALQSSPDWIYITSWNEWWENTQIEPSELYGDLYLKITRQYVAQWKNP